MHGAASGDYDTLLHLALLQDHLTKGFDTREEVGVQAGNCSAGRALAPAQLGARHAELCQGLDIPHRLQGRSMARVCRQPTTGTCIQHRLYRTPLMLVASPLPARPFVPVIGADPPFPAVRNVVPPHTCA